MQLKSGAVRKRARGIITETWQSQANLSLFLLLLVFAAFILPSLGFGKDDLRRYVNLTFSVMLISGVSIAWGRRILFPFAVMVGVITLVVRWIAATMPESSLTAQLWSNWWSTAAIGVIAFVLLTQVFRKGPVTHLRIQGAIAVYLLFGLGWAHAFHIAELLAPGSFSYAPGRLQTVGDWVYYSFVTLTTVGYGDITPVHQVARTLSVMEALTGQLYLAVMIARLIAMEVINWQMTTGPSSEQ